MTVSTLRTDRLVLRALRETDAAAIVAELNNYQVSKWLTAVPFPYTSADADWFIGENIAGHVRALIILRDERLVGMISLGRELGYWLAENAWGNGYATEAARAVVEHHFAQSDDDLVQSSHFVENITSRNVLTKLGFVDVGPHIHFSKARQAEVAGRLMELTRENFTYRATADVKPVT
ncbi:GNAT family N-acetyltransferase [Yoonia sp. 2307UL14-13]|uniref:GNAT family N-acetyltransferase n=1 Tax=Yoonia sp. 2307UL14-13 TaxID=3126506 RepID=UPI0030B773CF